MKDVAAAFVVLSLVCAIWAIVASLRMGAWLSHHGLKVNWIFFRAFMPRYVHRYQEMTREIEGRIGPLVPQFVVPINLALLFAVAALIAGAAAR